MKQEQKQKQGGALVKAVRKVGAVAALSASAVGSAVASTGGAYPTTLEGIQAWAEPKVGVAIALAVFFTCVILAIKISKTPRRA